MLGIHDYSYDLIYRLLQANHPDQPNEQYSYDPVGNRQGTTVDTGNRLLQDANYTYSYDNNGNLIQKINRTTSQLTTYGYDPENRLVQVTFPGMAVSYKYDSFGRRIEKNINGAITQYLYDDEDIILEYDGNNQIVGRYTHGPGTDEPLSMKKKHKYYYHFDGLGSVTGMTDNSGNLIQEYSYDSFGKIQNSLAPDLKQPYGYTGREWDEELGLYFYRARYYDPASGRFLTQDPIEFKGGINFYAYVQNNPINYTDPSGLASVLGGEGHFVVGGGMFEVSCCTENGKGLKHLYAKVCLGAAIGGSGGYGKVSNSDGASCSNPAKYLLGGELGAAAGPVSADGGYSVDTGGSGGSASGGLSVGLGAKLKATGCFYMLVSTAPSKDCCKK